MTFSLVVVEKVPESVSWSVPKLRLYREDVAELLAIFARTAEQVEVEVGGYRLSEAEELTEVPIEETSALSIKATGPYVSLTLTHVNGWLYASGSAGAGARGLADEVRAFLIRRRDRIGTVGVRLGYVSPGLATSALLAAAALYATGASSATVAGLLLLAVAWVIYTWWASREALRHHARIVLKPRAEAPGFFRRNGDKIILMLLGLVLGALLTKVLGQ